MAGRRGHRPRAPLSGMPASDARSRRRLSGHRHESSTPTGLPPADRPRCLRHLHVGVDRHAKGRRSAARRAIVRLVRNTNYLTIAPTDVFLPAAPLPFDASTLRDLGPLLNGGRVRCCWSTARASLAEIGSAMRRHHGCRPLTHRRAVPPDGRPAARRLARPAGALGRRRRASPPTSAIPRRWPQVRAGERLRADREHDVTAASRCPHRRCSPAGRQHRAADRQYPRLRARRADAAGAGRRPRRAVHRRRRARPSATSNAPELTAERFVADPFAARPGARLYRTGDLVRYRPTATSSSSAAAITRSRSAASAIELGEIERPCARTSTRAAVAWCARMRPGDKRLVAYVVAAGCTLDADELRRMRSGGACRSYHAAVGVRRPRRAAAPGHGKVDSQRAAGARPAARGPRTVPRHRPAPKR